MKKINTKIITIAMLIALVSLIILLTGCEKQTIPQDNQNQSTTNDSNNLSNTNNTQIANPASVNCINKGGVLEIINSEFGQQGICTLNDGTKCEEWALFRNECPNNCGTCPQMMPPAPTWCQNGTVIPTKDSCGCPHATCAENIKCTPEQKKAEICTMEYMPVCGWFNSTKIQCIKYPCASTYGNKCGACADEKVDFYTQGECPTGN